MKTVYDTEFDTVSFEDMQTVADRLPEYLKITTAADGRTDRVEFVTRRRFCEGWAESQPVRPRELLASVQQMERHLIPEDGHVDWFNGLLSVLDRDPHTVGRIQASVLVAGASAGQRLAALAALVRHQPKSDHEGEWER